MLPVPGVLPRGSQVGRLPQVQPHAVTGQLHGRHGRDRGPGRGARPTEAAQGLVHLFQGGSRRPAAGLDRLLHGDQDRVRRGEGTPWAAGPEPGPAAQGQREEQRTPQQGPGPDDALQQPRRRGVLLTVSGSVPSVQGNVPIRTPAVPCSVPTDAATDVSTSVGSGLRGAVDDGGGAHGGTQGDARPGGRATCRARLGGLLRLACVGGVWLRPQCGADVRGSPRIRDGRRRPFLLLAHGRVGQVQAPAGIDQVGVAQASPVRLDGARGGLVDLWPPVGLAQVLGGQTAEGVTGLHHHVLVLAGLLAGACPGLGRGEVQHHAGGDPVGATGQLLGVEVDDAVVVVTGPQVLGGDGPERVPRAHHVGDRGLLLGAGCRGRRDWGGGRAGPGRHRGRGRHRRGGCRRGRRNGSAGGGDEQGQRGHDQGSHAGLGQGQGRQPRRLDAAQRRDSLDDDAQAQGGPDHPAEQLGPGQSQGAVVRGQQGGADLVQAGEGSRQRVPAQGQQHGGQAHQDGGQDDQGAQAEKASTDSHCSTPPTDRVIRACAVPVALRLGTPMIDRNLVG
ncbi:hypothetical protein [Ornithinimicrobium kibberense]|uniref:hypothetical protein n=1 Tax=Ornithinimicrobium kibberense TaxID=282060 RepID=UPI003A90CCA8